MKIMRLILSTIFSSFTFFIASSLYTGIATSQKELKNEKPAIVFDLGGVLFHTKKFNFFFSQLGFRALAYASNLKKRWFNLLEKIAKENNHQYSLSVEIKDDAGDVLPSYMLEWLTGYRSNQEICDEVCACIKKNPDWFGPGEKQLMLNMAHGIFIADQFLSTQYVIDDTVKLIKKLKKNGYPLYILSNWDKETFDRMTKKYPALFALFDGFVVSGYQHKAKPDLEMYKELESLYPHSNYVLIDNQKDNISAAKECGWFGIETKTASLDRKLIYSEIKNITDAIAQESDKLKIIS